MSKLTCVIATLLASSLVACGGGGGGSSGTSTTTTSSVTASRGLGYENYVAKSGSLATAKVADTNHIAFARLLLAVTMESEDTGLLRPEANTLPTTYTNNPLEGASANAVRKDIETLIRRFEAARNGNLKQGSVAAKYVNDTVSCADGGNATVKGDVDNTTLTGKLDLTFNSCIENNSLKLGSATLTLNKRDTTTSAFTDYTLEYNDLTVKTAWAYFLYTGTQHAVRTLTNGVITKFVVTSNMRRLDQYQNDIEGLTLDTTENTSALSGLQLTGQLCDGRFGCVTVSTKQAFSTAGRGEVVLTGEGNSTSQIYFQNGVLVSRVDSEGTGHYGLPIQVF